MAATKYLLLGARGLVGRAVVAALEAEGGSEIVGLARGAPNFPTAVQFFSCDLTDRAACEATFKKPELDAITHIVYAALQELPDLIAGWQDPLQIETNTRMLENVLDFLEPRDHFTLLQGTKAYGAHLAPMKLPGRETDPRHPGGNFYWEQEDLVRARQRDATWTFSIMRPQIVCGVAVGSPMNMVMAIGIYAAVMRKLGEPLRFPGRGGFVTEAADADLLARAILWAGREPACANETLNVTNGDVLEWLSLWGVFADVFGIPEAEPKPTLLSQRLPPLAGVWDDIVLEHGPQPYTMTELVGDSWQFADAVLGYGGGRSTLLSTIKIRELGFHECVDTEQMFRGQLAALQDLRILPR